ncbi:349_t:CDS:10 [Diversispora eburnea]|uniref:349_t:CDS:1 n=1 Tax=Diversispora eburnea TaxID=1213867 RepID=A0A9N9B6U9_9GLOM|nr:349_t:CDS:10 [Diversispora eburnea]
MIYREKAIPIVYSAQDAECDFTKVHEIFHHGAVVDVKGYLGQTTKSAQLLIYPKDIILFSSSTRSRITLSTTILEVETPMMTSSGATAEFIRQFHNESSMVKKIIGKPIIKYQCSNNKHEKFRDNGSSDVTSQLFIVVVIGYLIVKRQKLILTIVPTSVPTSNHSFPLLNRQVINMSTEADSLYASTILTPPCSPHLPPALQGYSKLKEHFSQSDKQTISFPCLESLFFEVFKGHIHHYNYRSGNYKCLFQEVEANKEGIFDLSGKRIPKNQLKKFKLPKL